MLVGNSVFAPFNDSEQIGSHARPPELMSKPVSPNNVNALITLQGGVGDHSQIVYLRFSWSIAIVGARWFANAGASSR